MRLPLVSWILYSLAAIIFHLLMAGVIFLGFMTLGMFLPGSRFPVLGTILWLGFFFTSFWTASLMWKGLLNLQILRDILEKKLGKEFQSRSWI